MVASGHMRNGYGVVSVRRRRKKEKKGFALSLRSGGEAAVAGLAVA